MPRYNEELVRGVPALFAKWSRLWNDGCRPPVAPWLEQVEQRIAHYRKMLQRRGTKEIARRQQWVADLRQELTAYRKGQTGVANVCGQCRGFCCVQHAGTGDLFDPVDLCLYSLADDASLSAYACNPDGPGCLFLGDRGCNLPADLRPRVCVLYVCDLTRPREDVDRTQRLHELYQQAFDLPVMGTGVTMADVIHVLEQQGYRVFAENCRVVFKFRGRYATYPVYIRQLFEHQTLLFCMHIPVSAKGRQEELARLAAKVNREYPLATMELDWDVGEIRARARLLVHDTDLEVAQFRATLDALVNVAETFMAGVAFLEQPHQPVSALADP